ncbi:MAG: tetratricopeptide repeat protein [Verrucomicrobiota bacterium]
MQTKDAPAEILIQIWPWLEANKNRLIAVVAALLALWGIYFFVNTRHEQNEIAAGQALTQLLVAPAAGANAGQMADAFAQLAVKYPGTAAGLRAQLQAATAMFSAGRYADAQAQFKKVLAAAPAGALAATAQLGVATSLEAQNKPEAAAAYQQVVSQFPGSAAAESARQSLSRIQKPATKS